jgi:hypothetical protein
MADTNVELWFRPEDGDDEPIRVSKIDPLPVEMDTSPSAGFSTGQNVLSTTAELLVPYRASRKRAVVKCFDSAAVSIYVGSAQGVTSSTGMEIKAGESFSLYTTAAIYAVAASGTPTAGYVEEHD